MERGKGKYLFLGSVVEPSSARRTLILKNRPKVKISNTTMVGSKVKAKFLVEAPSAAVPKTLS